MSYKMFLDDIRQPSDVGYNDNEFVIVRTFCEAVDYIDLHGMPSFISFDHDLGEEYGFDGYDLAKYVCDVDMNTYILFPDDFSFNVHSANPIGAANIQKYLDNYLKHRS